MTAVRHTKDARSESLASAATRIWDECSRDTNAAIERLILEIRKRPSLHEEAYRIAAERLVRDQRGTDNSRLLRGLDIPPLTTRPENTASHQTPAAKAAISSRLSRVIERLDGLFGLTFRHNGTDYVLGKSTPEELRPIAAHYVGQGQTMVRTGRWLEKVIASAKDGQPIVKSLSLPQLEAFKAEADALSV